MKLQQKKSKTFSDHTGSLIPFYFKSSLSSFSIKRFFFVYGNTKYSRADHAHKKCNQILIPIFGQIKVEITTLKKRNKNFTLSKNNNNYLFVPKKKLDKIKI